MKRVVGTVRYILPFWAFVLFLAACSVDTGEPINSPAPPSPAQASSSIDQWYVDPIRGKDENSGKSPAAAFATLARSVRGARESSSTDKRQIITLLSSPSVDLEKGVRSRGKGKTEETPDDAVFDFSYLYVASTPSEPQPELLIRGTDRGPPVELHGAEGMRVLNVGAGENLRLENVRFTGGDAIGNGGGALVVKGGRLVLGDGVVVAGNTAAGHGRGIFCSEGSLVLAGTAEFAAQDDIYLAGNETITLERGLQKGVATVTLGQTDGRFIFTAPPGSGQTLDSLQSIISQFTLCYVGKDGGIKTASSSARGWFAPDDTPEPDTFYVDNNGNDTATGWTLGTAFRTLDAAFDAIRSGAPIRTVTVTEGLTRPALGAAVSPDALWLATDLGIQEVTLRGYRAKPGDTPTALRGAPGLRVLSVTGKTVLRIADLIITGGDAPQGAGLYVGQDAEVTLDGVIIDGNRGETGAGAYVAGKMTLSGATRFGDADRLFLESGHMVTVSGVLSADTVAALELAETEKSRKVLQGPEGDLAANHDKFTIHMKEPWAKAGVPALCPDAQGLVVIGADYYVWSGGDDQRERSPDGRRTFKTLSAAVAAAREAASKDHAGKTLMVIGTLNAESEKGASPERVFVIPARGGGAAQADPLITITGWFSRQDPPRLSALGTGKGVLLIEGTSTAISLSNIEIIGGRATAGAGLYVNGANVTLDEGTVFSNNAAADVGGGIYAQNANITVANAVIGGSGGDVNEAKQGGGIYVESSILNVTGGRIEGNRGGGVFASASVTTVSGGTITANNAINGGGLSVHDGELTLTGGIISANTSGGKGAAVYLESSNDTLGSTFTMKGGDISRHVGTAVFIDSYGSFILSGGTISRNGSSTAEGGGVALYSARFTMSGGEISNNEAVDGGGVWLQGLPSLSASFDLKNGQIKANKAKRGGGVFTGLGYFAQIGGVINGNSAEDGGGIYSGLDSLNCSLSDGAVISANKASSRGGGLFVARGDHFAKQGGGAIFGGTREDIRAWADLTNSSGDGVSHAVFFAAPEKTVAKTVSKTEDLAG